MPAAKPRTIEELKERRKAIKEQAAAEIAAIRKATAERNATLKTCERKLRAENIRNRKKQENHAKILLGVAVIHLCQTSPTGAAPFKTLLKDFYSSSPERMEAAFKGLDLVVTKPSSDADRD